MFKNYFGMTSLLVPFVIISLAVTQNVVLAQNSSGQQQIDLARHYLQEGKDWRQAAKILRTIAIQEQEDSIMAAYMMLGEIRDKHIRPLYPEITDNEYHQNHDSVGLVLVNKSDYGKGIDALIDEAWCLSAAAQTELEILYRHDVESNKRWDRRILKYYEESAEERLSQSQFFLGNIYMNGWGVAKDQEKGQKLLNASNWKARGFQLP